MLLKAMEEHKKSDGEFSPSDFLCNIVEAECFL